VVASVVDPLAHAAAGVIVAALLRDLVAACWALVVVGLVLAAAALLWEVGRLRLGRS
jgi:hypothetical protein